MSPDADLDRLPTALDPNDADPDSDDDGIRDGTEFRFYNSNLRSTNSDGDRCGDLKEISSVNSDSVVNSSDLGLVASQYGRVPPFPYTANMDVNKDGFVNAMDLGIVAKAFGFC